MKTIKEWEKYFTELKLNKKIFKMRLNVVLGKIAFLEEIYQTYGRYSDFSETFKDCALAERQALCQKSSALYNLIREKQ